MENGVPPPSNNSQSLLDMIRQALGLSTSPVLYANSASPALPPPPTVAPMPAHVQSGIPNAQYAKPGPYITTLNPIDEMQFQQWAKANHIPFDPSSRADYDMRGFWLALKSGDPRASTGMNPNDKQLHFTDVWKTPYHQSFSNESQYAQPSAPHWNEQDQLIDPTGRVVYDERKPKL